MPPGSLQYQCFNPGVEGHGPASGHHGRIQHPSRVRGQAINDTIITLCPRRPARRIVRTRVPKNYCYLLGAARAAVHAHCIAHRTRRSGRVVARCTRRSRRFVTGCTRGSGRVVARPAHAVTTCRNSRSSWISKRLRYLGLLATVPLSVG